MRPIDADKLMELYENTPECNIDDYHVSIPVIRQNILDMPTVNPYKWIGVEDRLPECEWGAESEAVLYITKQGFMYTGYYGCGGIFHDRYFREYKNAYEGCDISNVTHWMPLPASPTVKEN